MGNININIPEDLHNELRHISIDENKEIRDLIVESIKLVIQKYKGKKK